tara:strand:+ start:142 stop:444 length:303 start_codon:yes stop_codon:yes gene_type:complete
MKKENYRLTMAFSEREDGVNKLKTIAHPLRLEIVKCLFKNKKMSVTELQTDLNLQQPVVSHHLTKLKVAGIVNHKKDGKYHIYFLEGKSGNYVRMSSQLK